MQGFPTFLFSCTSSAFQQISPFYISTDGHVPLKYFTTKYFIMIIYRYI